MTKGTQHSSPQNCEHILEQSGAANLSIPLDIQSTFHMSVSQQHLFPSSSIPTPPFMGHISSIYNFETPLILQYPSWRTNKNLV